MKIEVIIGTYSYPVDPNLGSLSGQPVTGEVFHVEVSPSGANTFKEVFVGAVNAETLDLDVSFNPGDKIDVRVMATDAGQQSPYSGVVTYTLPFPPLPTPVIQSVKEI